MRISIALFLLVLTGGCARYEFDLVEPADLATHIGGDKESLLKRDELEYRFQAVDNRLLMYIVNPTEDAIELIGPESTAVDPRGQSHSLRSQAIAPHSYVKLILPPMRPYYRTGPSFGIGVGIHASRGRGAFWPGFYDPSFDEPQYFTVVDEADTVYWSWEDESEARIRLTFRRGKEVFHHNFLFRRKKV
ncbi:MAG TPA: hypothetical protein VGQ99_01930 [Tepidisphaeraceae bacterium]|jgi:hypothetical protein|nr:hypothetical protein [Tepidisphaeraceae bacterium]